VCLLKKTKKKTAISWGGIQGGKGEETETTRGVKTPLSCPGRKQNRGKKMREKEGWKNFRHPKGPKLLTGIRKEPRGIIRTSER